MCGTFIGILVSSGWLLLLANEGQRKILLLPLLLLLVATFWGYKKTACNHKIPHILFYLAMSLLISALFMLYIFIPWWLGDYNGGPLLP